MAIGDYEVPRPVDFESEPGWIRVRPYVAKYTDPDEEAEPFESDEEAEPFEPDDEAYDEPEPFEAAEEETDQFPLVPRPRPGAAPARGPTSLARPSRRSDNDGPPVGRHAFRRRGGGRSLVLLAGVGVAGLIAIVWGVVLAGTGGRPGGPGTGSPATQAGGGARPGAASGPNDQSRPSDQSRPGGPSGTAGTAQSTDPAVLAASPSGAGTTGSAGTTLGPTQSQADPGAGRSPTALPPTWSPPPATDVTGPITNVAGLCLASSDDRARLWSCDGTSSQTWTLAADGTLRLSNQCLQPGNGLARLGNCDGSAAQQWRVGPAGSLVDPAAAGCLGDPQAGANKGTPQRTAPCDQSDAQRWVLSGTGGAAT